MSGLKSHISGKAGTGTSSSRDHTFNHIRVYLSALFLTHPEKVRASHSPSPLLVQVVILMGGGPSSRLKKAATSMREEHTFM